MPFARLGLCSILALSACSPAAGDDEVGGTVTSSQTETETAAETSVADTSSSQGESDATTDGGPSCGDGRIEGDEACDGENLGAATCQSLGFDAGELACTHECTYDDSDCEIVVGPDPTSCTSDEECESGQCYVAPFIGGVCGECNEDADCAESTGGGCTPPNPVDATPPTCNLGEVGAGCQTSAVCQEGLVCADALALRGLVEITTCGECVNDADCNEGLICAPIVNLAKLSGVNTCTTPSTLAQDSYCELDGSGDAACITGVCSAADIMGIAQMGVCGECHDDADCGAGTCNAAVFDVDTTTLIGSTCQ